MYIESNGDDRLIDGCRFSHQQFLVLLRMRSEYLADVGLHDDQKIIMRLCFYRWLYTLGRLNEGDFDGKETLR